MENEIENEPFQEDYRLLRIMRESFNLSHDALAAKLGISLTTVYELEAGERDLTHKMAAQWARACNWSALIYYLPSPETGQYEITEEDEQTAKQLFSGILFRLTKIAKLLREVEMHYEQLRIVEGTFGRLLIDYDVPRSAVKQFHSFFHHHLDDEWLIHLKAVLYTCRNLMREEEE